MASTVYSNAAAGQLEIIFYGPVASSTTTDAGFPGSNGSSEIVLECTVTDGGGVIGKTYVRAAVPSAQIALAYPGGSVAWTVSMTVVKWSIGGLGSVGVIPRAYFILIKK